MHNNFIGSIQSREKLDGPFLIYANFFAKSIVTYMWLFVNFSN